MMAIEYFWQNTYAYSTKVWHNFPSFFLLHSSSNISVEHIIGIISSICLCSSSVFLVFSILTPRNKQTRNYITDSITQVWSTVLCQMMIILLYRSSLLSSDVILKNLRHSYINYPARFSSYNKGNKFVIIWYTGNEFFCRFK